MIEISKQHIRSLAHSFLSLRVVESFAEQVTPRVRASDEAALRAFLWASAICHSTKESFKGFYGGNFYKGWDYLLRAFCSAAEESEAIVSSSNIKRISGRELVSLLERYARNAQVQVPDADRRAEILNGCAIQLEEKFSGTVSELLRRASNKVDGNNGAYFQLAQLDAFQDVLKKKSSAFLMTVHFSGLWTISDQENVLPMIDYHRMRILCRTGCISIQDIKLQQALVSQRPVSQEVEELIRVASAKVCESIVTITGIPMFEFDVLLWAHARSCCRNHPVCISGKLENDSFYQYLGKPFDGHCVFQEWCPGFRNSIIRELWEPIVKTEHY
jgi:hypothetical protein